MYRRGAMMLAGVQRRSIGRMGVTSLQRAAVWDAFRDLIAAHMILSDAFLFGFEGQRAREMGTRRPTPSEQRPEGAPEQRPEGHERRSEARTRKYRGE